MNYKPILLSGPVVRSILEGKKSQTRRIIKPQPDDQGLHNHTRQPMSIDSELKGWWGIIEETGEAKEFKCPYGAIGDVLWLRETWGYEFGGGYLYRASHEHMKATGCLSDNKWKPAIHMPKSACRLFLQITDIRVTRLQDISEADSLAEGIDDLPFGARGGFNAIWDEINGPESWQANPWVWIIHFKRIDKPDEFPNH